MGWDAYALDAEGKALFEYEDRRGLFIKDRVCARAFKNASDDVRNKTKTVDGLLHNGGLDCSACGDAIHRLTGVDQYGLALSIQQVQELTITPYEPLPEDAWAYYSALEFIKVCQEQKLGIRFSW